jgi:predicted PhzF superfamily epimerase YddE/YHI9
MNLPIYWVDAFTDHVFGGNPAAVVPLDAWPDDALLQQIANQNGLSETAFFIRTGPARAKLRWFTPTVEMDLCGHATLATAHVLFNYLGQSEFPFVFETMSGSLSVARRGDLFELNFPARPASPTRPPPALISGLGPSPRETLRLKQMWLCVYASEAEVKALAPDFSALATVDPGKFIVTAPGTDCDFVSRFFAPGAGINEDPVTGSAHCTLVPYWAAKLGKGKLHARQVSRRGGELWCELAGDRVRMAGKGVSYLQGRIDT